MAIRNILASQVRGKRGVSLIEALVALAVLSFGLYGAAELVTASRRNGQMASWRAEAAGLAALKLEELRLAAPAIKELLQGKSAGQAVAFPEVREARIFPQNKRLSWVAKVKVAPEDGARLDIQVEVHRTAKPEDEVPIVAQGVAFLSTWPDVPGGNL